MTMLRGGQATARSAPPALEPRRGPERRPHAREHDGRIEIHVDGRTLLVPATSTLAAALLDGGVTGFRRSLSGELRGPVCGMGICHECVVTVDGVPHRRACLEPVVPGMRVSTRG